MLYFTRGQGTPVYLRRVETSQRITQDKPAPGRCHGADVFADQALSVFVQGGSVVFIGVNKILVLVIDQQPCRQICRGNHGVLIDVVSTHLNGAGKTTAHPENKCTHIKAAPDNIGP